MSLDKYLTTTVTKMIRSHTRELWRHMQTSNADHVKQLTEALQRANRNDLRIRQLESAIRGLQIDINTIRKQQSEENL